ncbi:hypothetical protein [Sphingobium cupriresistens]|uniref:Lipoprotein n=1 Tax=Sphingobium cupriresistens LL01 TaxID=1420583 RepID=A0A0J7XWH9_9SPHN|nr:hypothetical protein [Sphingobium cupriresistens]KMS55944.1 hypothetical protein V473_13645 [Sphingobium cupriresistens LL01]
MRNYRIIAMVVATLTLAACDRNRSAAEDAVRGSLKDPDSAKFGDFYYNEKTKKGCLTVNARNSMGGYTGDQQAYVEPGDKGWLTIGFADVSQESCRNVFADAVQDETSN